jgi:hypothetical protein
MEAHLTPQWEACVHALTCASQKRVERYVAVISQFTHLTNKYSLQWCQLGRGYRDRTSTLASCEHSRSLACARLSLRRAIRQVCSRILRNITVALLITVVAPVPKLPSGVEYAAFCSMRLLGSLLNKCLYTSAAHRSTDEVIGN